MRRSCELCKAVARMYCDSDQANLCWDCDAKVHSANFLVARHSRSLLCHVCHSPTAWNAYGAKLGPTVSVCLSCVDNSGGFKELDKVEESPPDEVVHTEDEYDESEDDDSDEEQLSGDDEDGENQVVPLSLTPPPQEACSSDSQASSSRFSNRDGDYSLKRLHENDTNLSSDDDRILSYRGLNNRMTPSSMAARGGEIAPVDSLTRQLKSRRIEASAQNGQSVSISAVIVEPLWRFHEAK